jgi:hypothetical protein
MYRWFIYIGILFIVVGFLIKFAPWLINWFGKLPGDIFYDKGDTKIFFPITSMLLISFILSMILWIIRKYF